MKTLRTLALTCLVALVAAGCNPFEKGKDASQPWHFWIATFLVLGVVLLCAALVVGYVVKIIVPKYRGR